jgi:hypothetical protein
MGAEGSIPLFEHTPDFRKFDGTHHSPYGAYELAKCVIEGIRASELPLAREIAEDVPAFDPANPDAERRFNVPASLRVAGERPLGD